jgi:bifunctional DNase/RNase
MGEGDATGRMRVVELCALGVDLPSTDAVVTLREVDPPGRLLRIPIGQAEGVAIAYAWRQLPTPRPLTHELFTEALGRFDLRVELVEVTEVSGFAFSAQLRVVGPQRSEVVPCRPSDGIALALRQRPPAPILVDEAVLQAAGGEPPGP